MHYCLWPLDGGRVQVSEQHSYNFVLNVFIFIIIFVPAVHILKFLTLTTVKVNLISAKFLFNYMVHTNSNKPDFGHI